MFCSDNDHFTNIFFLIFILKFYFQVKLIYYETQHSKISPIFCGCPLITEYHWIYLRLNQGIGNAVRSGTRQPCKPGYLLIKSYRLCSTGIIDTLRFHPRLGPILSQLEIQVAPSSFSPKKTFIFFGIVHVVFLEGSMRLINFDWI